MPSVYTHFLAHLLTIALGMDKLLLPSLSRIPLTVGPVLLGPAIYTRVGSDLQSWSAKPRKAVLHRKATSGVR